MNSPSSKARTLAMTSGKGGVGKTCITANLAACLALSGKKVLVLDADLGLANLDVILNIQPQATLHDVINETITLRQAIVKAPGGFDVLPAGSGVVEHSRLTGAVRDKLLHIMEEAKQTYDWILIDTGAGISDVVLFAVSLAQEVLVVATPEPTAITDAYATIKVLATQQGWTKIGMVINQCNRAGEGLIVATQLQAVLQRFVIKNDHVHLHLFGEVRRDNAMLQSILKRKLLMQIAPTAESAQAIQQIAKAVENGHPIDIEGAMKRRSAQTV